MKNEAVSARSAAARSLVSFAKHSKYTNLEVDASLSRYGFSDADRRLYTALVYGVAERIPTLDYVVGLLSSRPLEEIDIETLTCLRLGLYQLMYMDRIPDHAAVSETVASAGGRSKGFVNALLREFLRRGKTYPLPEEGSIERFSVEYSCPVPMCEFLTEKLGRARAESFLASTLEKRPVTLRVNTLAATPEELLGGAFPDGRISPLSDDMIEVGAAGAVMTDGRYFVQDAASRLAVSALAPEPGETVVDTCAAPGGKTFSAAIDMCDKGELYSFELHENRLGLIVSGAERLGLHIVKAARRDAADPDPALIGRADRVICDAPCSGLGVIGKKPDIKYKNTSDIDRLPAVQLRVLGGAAQYVRPGGVLVYSTCTLNPDENEGVVRRFLGEHPDFAPCPFTAGKIPSDADGTLTLGPCEHGTDGFFIAKMTRRTGDL